MFIYFVPFEKKKWMWLKAKFHAKALTLTKATICLIKHKTKVDQVDYD